MEKDEPRRRRLARRVGRLRDTILPPRIQPEVIATGATSATGAHESPQTRPVAQSPEPELCVGPAPAPSQETQIQPNTGLAVEAQPSPTPPLAPPPPAPALDQHSVGPDPEPDAFRTWYREQWNAGYDVAGKRLTQAELTKLKSLQSSPEAVIEEARRAQETAQAKQWRYTRNGEEVIVADQIGNILKGIEKYAKIIDIAIQHSPEITALVWGAARFIITVALNWVEAMESLGVAMEKIVTTMGICEYYASIYKDLEGENIVLGSRRTESTYSHMLRTALPEFYATVIVFSVQATKYFSQPAHTKVLESVEPFSLKFKPILDELEQREQSLRRIAEQATMRVTKNILNVSVQVKTAVEELKGQFNPPGEPDGIKSELEQAWHLDKHPCARSAAFNSRLWENMSFCLEDTRVDLLKGILEWCREDSVNSPCIYWLNGMAGMGKSTIARTIAHNCAERRRLGASFFFSKGQTDLNNADKFFPTIAVQLASSIPAVKPAICKAIVENPDVSDRILSEQWKNLILGPLSTLKGEISRLFVVVIDALDECDKEDDIRRILHLLPQANDLPLTRLKILVTSRPEIPIRLGFRKMSEVLHQDLKLKDVPRDIIDHDISLYFQRELRDIKLDPQNLTSLVERAGGLFIWAATACRFVRRGGERFVERRLSLILGNRASGRNPEEELDEIYTAILLESIKSTDDEEETEEIFELLKRIIGVTVVLFSPLPIDALRRLLQIPREEVKLTLDGLHSVLEIPENEDDPIRLLHPSLRDFLLDGQRCQDVRLKVDERQVHCDLLYSCLNCMSEALKKDICNLQYPGTPTSSLKKTDIDQFIPRGAQYACRYWVNHLQRSNITICDNDKTLSHFLETNILHWFEALGLMEIVSEGIHAIVALESVLSRSNCRKLTSMVYDAKRFILSNRWIIERYPLQTYCSALIFCPNSSQIKTRFSGGYMPGWMKVAPTVQSDWDPLLQVLEGHSRTVGAIAFSPDGKVLASGSQDGTVRLWDPISGAELATLQGHSGGVCAVAFSPSGKALASGLKDGTVRLWDPTSGAELATLQGHSGPVLAVAFSPDGKALASGSWDDAVRLWDPTSGAELATLQGHSGPVRAVAFSPDGKALASGPQDGTVRLWDPTSGAELATLQGRSGPVRAVAFSPDGKALASGSWDGTVRLWDPTSGAELATLQGRSGPVLAVAFSPDGKALASGSWDGTVQLWDPTSGAELATLQGHSGPVRAVAFSPDGKALASGSQDCTVRLWDMESHELVQMLKFDRYISRISFRDGGRALETNAGTVSLELFGANSLLEAHLSSPWSVSDDWIYHGARKICWLPVNFRSVCADVYGNFIALGHRSGSVSIIQLDPNALSSGVVASGYRVSGDTDAF